MFCITTTFIKFDFRIFNFRLTDDTVLSVHKLAQSFLCTDLVSVCEEYIFQNFESIARTSSFLNLEFCELIYFLQSHELCISGEERLFFIIISWVEYQSGEDGCMKKAENFSGDDWYHTNSLNDDMRNYMSSTKHRSVYLPDLLECIRFHFISSDFIFTVIACHPLIRYNFACR